MNEVLLIKEIQAGNKAAFSELVSAYRNKVLNTCNRFLIDKQDAEDASQEVFIEVFRSIHSFRSESKLSTWIYRIAVTKSLDALKKRKRKHFWRSVSTSLHLFDFVGNYSNYESADQPLIQKEQMNEIKKALDKLPENQRIAFTLSKIDGFGNSEIADIMNTTKIAVESLLFRAKRRIGEELKKILINSD